MRAYITGKPIWCTWQVTYACNFRCTFCDYWKEEVNYRPEGRAREATADDFRMGSEKLAEFGSLIISLAGGEPFLRRDLAEITAALARQHFPLITTNGSLVNEQRARELWDAGLWGISVSLDYGQASPDAQSAIQQWGCRTRVARRPGEFVTQLKAADESALEQHDLQRGVRGAAERARRAIQILSRTRTWPYQQVNLLCVLNDRNLGDVEELVRFAAENHATFSIQPYCSFKSGKHQFAPESNVSAHLLALKKRYPNFRSSAGFLANFDRFRAGGGIGGCKAGRAFFNVDNLLNVHKCVEFREEPAGNLRELSAKQILERLRAEYRRNTCTACWYGCRGEVETLYTMRGLLSAAPMLANTRWMTRRPVVSTLR